MKYTIPMVVGAIIGYVTNWLAIKMLFRPHYEKRIMGFKIPFTPGLIPKEKTAIAKKIGGAVGEYLLSPKAIVETLEGQEANEQIQSWIEGRIDKIRDSGKSIEELGLSLFRDKYGPIVEGAEKSIHGLIMKVIRSEKTKIRVLSLVREKLYDDRTYEEIKENIGLCLEKILGSEKIEKTIEETIEKEFNNILQDNRILKDVLPEKVKWKVDIYLDDNIEEIGSHIRKIMESPNIQYKLKESISNIVDQNVSKLITSFIPAQAISEKIYLAIEKYINDENSNKDLLLIIKSFLERIMESKVSELTSGILEKLSPEDLSKYILEYLGSIENKETIINLINEKIKEVDPEKIVEKLSKEIDLVLKGDKLEREVSILVKDTLLEFLNRPVIGILDIVEGHLSKIYDYSKMIFDTLILDHMPSIIELFPVSKIVEDEINKFDVEFTEGLILDIAHRELKAITRLGALLGGIIGLLSPLLQN